MDFSSYYRGVESDPFLPSLPTRGGLESLSLQNGTVGLFLGGLASCEPAFASDWRDLPFAFVCGSSEHDVELLGIRH